MDAGKLRHRLSFQARAGWQDPETGESLPGAWTDVVTVWGSVQPLSARELLAAQAAQSVATKRIIIRFRPGIEPTMRIVHRGVVYDIVGPALEDKVSGLEYLTILVSAGATDG
jgi:SPP1 family predicted phage head-tail adaptor